MVKITDILPNFATLKEYRDFLDQLVEKKADGQEIARGMDKHDKSKQEKKQVVSKEVKKNANGSSTETHYDHIDPEPEQPPEEQEAPATPLQPGQQVNIGNKNINKSYLEPKTVDIKIGGEKDKIDLKPKVDLINNRLS